MNLFSLYPFLMEVLFGKDKPSRKATLRQRLMAKPWVRKLTVWTILGVFALAYHQYGQLQRMRNYNQALRDRAIYYKTIAAEMSARFETANEELQRCKVPINNPPVIAQSLEAAKPQRKPKPNKPAPQPQALPPPPPPAEVVRKFDQLKKDQTSERTP